MHTEAGASTHPPASLTQEERSSYRFLVVLTAIALAADLASKAWAKMRLSGFDPQKLTPRKLEVVKDHLDFIYALNPGGAWSFLRGLPDSLRRPFFLFVSASAIVFIVSIYRRVPRRQFAMKWGLPLALGGAIGNLVDRVRYGSVIDFIDMYFKRGGREHHWPTFNVADIAIVIGVGLMVIDMLRPQRAEKKPPGGEEPAQASALTTTTGAPPDGPHAIGAALALALDGLPTASAASDSAPLGAMAPAAGAAALPVDMGAALPGPAPIPLQHVESSGSAPPDAGAAGERDTETHGRPPMLPSA